MHQFARALAPGSLVFVYLRGVIELLPIYCEVPCFYLINLWYVINMFISSKRALGYNNLRAGVVPMLWSVVLMMMNFVL